MKSFDTSPCPKCRTGRSNIRVRWCDKHRDLGASHRSLCPLPEKPTDLWGAVASDEHMHHACGTCGYEWITKPADALVWLPSRRKAARSSSSS